MGRKDETDRRKIKDTIKKKEKDETYSKGTERGERVRDEERKRKGKDEKNEKAKKKEKEKERLIKCTM